MSPPSLTALPAPAHPTPLADTEPLFEFPVTYSKFLLAVYFTCGHVSFHVTPYISPSPLSPCPEVCSLCLKQCLLFSVTIVSMQPVNFHCKLQDRFYFGWELTLIASLIWAEHYVSTIQFQSCGPNRLLWWSRLEVRRWRQLGAKPQQAFLCFLMTSIDHLSEERWGLPSKVCIQLLFHPLIFFSFFLFWCGPLKK